MKKSAILVIDMLEDFVREEAPLEVPSTRKIIPFLQKELKKARERGIPVIYVCDAHEREDIEFKKYGWLPHCIKGTEGARIIEELKPEEGDIIVEKKTYSGFYETNLEEILKEKGVENLYLTGCVTHICVLFTASDAVLRGYNVFVLEEGVAGLEEEDHRAALRIMKNVLGAKIIKEI
ncbi:MAG: isochorismatase family cysteine hydrolase [Thermoanaerobaculia bacterium]